MISRAETWRAARSADSSAMVDWLRGADMVTRQFWDEEEAVGLDGGVAEGVFVGKAGANFVGAKDVDEGDGVGGGFDVGDVGLLEFLDIADDVGELAAEGFLLGRRQEMRARCATYLMSKSEAIGGRRINPRQICV